MIVQIVSDLHLDLNPSVKLSKILVPSAEILLILGDISEHQCYEKLLKYVTDKWKLILIVSGNHEYYNKYNTIEEIDEFIEDKCNSYKNIIYLNNKCFEYEDYVFIGSTLWSYVSDIDASDMNDYNFINKNRKVLIKPNDIRKLFKLNKLFIEESIQKYNNKKIVIMTHHIPFLVTEHSAFCSDMTYLMNNPVKYWFCGHTHVSLDKTINNTRILTNPFGYIDNNEYENRIFRNDYTVDLV